MKVNKNSWHYKLWKLGRIDFLSLVEFVIPTKFFGNPNFWDKDKVLYHTSCSSNLCQYFWGVIFGPVTFLAKLIVTFLVMTMMVLSFVLFVIAIPVLTVYEKLFQSKPTQPSLIRSYINARKAKVCPLIVFEDGNGNQ